MRIGAGRSDVRGAGSRSARPTVMDRGDTLATAVHPYADHGTVIVLTFEQRPVACSQMR